MFMFTDDKINLFLQSYVHNNNNKSIVQFIKLFFKNKFFKSKELTRQQEHKLKKQKEKQLRKIIFNMRIIFLINRKKRNNIKQLQLDNVYNKLQEIKILNKNETQKNIFENNLTLNNTILYL